MPLFNDVNPGDEIFGTHYRFAREAVYIQRHQWTSYYQRRHQFAFYHSGYDPPDAIYLLSDAEGAILKTALLPKKSLLLASTGIDGERCMFTTIPTQGALEGTFGSIPITVRRSATTAGKAGVNIYDTWNHTVPNNTAGIPRVAWNFDAGDNGGAGWTSYSAAGVGRCRLAVRSRHWQ